MFLVAKLSIQDVNPQAIVVIFQATFSNVYTLEYNQPLVGEISKDEREHFAWMICLLVATLCRVRVKAKGLFFRFVYLSVH